MNKRKCVLGVLKTELGLKIKEEMLAWLEPVYDVTLVEVNPPNDIEFELPFIKKACEVAIESNEPVLYLHTKGAAMQNSAQPRVRNFWRIEFGKNADTYFNSLLNDTASVSAPIVGTEKPVCWFNGYVMNVQAAKAILNTLSPHTDRYWFEQSLLGEAGVKTVGVRDMNAEDGNWAWRSFCYCYAILTNNTQQG